MDKLQSAIQYAQKGFAVLPVIGKHPLIKFADHPALTTSEINYYWSKYPDANIALRTIDFFVVDIDTKKAHGKDGLASAKKLIQNKTLISTLEQQTASGGRQLFYLKPNERGLKQVIGLRPGIDIKANPNNYVVVPPSTTSKGQYRWIDSNTPMNEPTNELIQLINSFSQHNQTSPKNAPAGHIAGKTWTGMVLDNLVTGAPEGRVMTF